MGFWGLEVKPGKPQAYRPKDEQGKLHLTQATLGAGLGKEKSVIQCSIGDKTPVYLCSLLPNKTESCPLNLEFDDDDESVVFSVTGDRSIHLSGYLEAYEEEYDQDEDDDSDGIDIGESGESSDYDSEDDEMDEFDDFLDSDLEMYPHSSVPNSGVVIEEIEDEEEPAKDNKTKRPKKKSQDENANKQIIAKASSHVPVLESEDEDGFPILKEKVHKPENKIGDDEQGSNKKRKAKTSEQDGVQESANKNKKKKNQKEKNKDEEAAEQIQTPIGTVNNAMAESSETPDTSAKKKNKKKKKKNANEEATVESKTTVEKQKPDPISEEKKVNSKSSVRTYPNGLIVEEIAMGKPNGKKAVPGATVNVRYIGKLQKNGKQFDCNLKGFKFRLGCGLVIKGWDVGVNGMRVGDKRKLTIPPSMGYGQKGAGGDIPPNAWLVFDVELVDVR